MKCSKCIKQKQKSIVTVTGVYTNAGPYYPIQYDQDGNLLPRPTPTTTTSYSCSNGHNWTEKS